MIVRTITLTPPIDDNKIILLNIDLEALHKAGHTHINKTPVSAKDTGNVGDIYFDTNYMYICTAINTWKRTAISTW